LEGSSFKIISGDIIAEIFGKLDIQPLLACSLVCKEFNAATHKSGAWRGALINDNPLDERRFMMLLNYFDGYRYSKINAVNNSPLMVNEKEIINVKKALAEDIKRSFQISNEVLTAFESRHNRPNYHQLFQRLRLGLMTEIGKFISIDTPLKLAYLLGNESIIATEIEVEKKQLPPQKSISDVVRLGLIAVSGNTEYFQRAFLAYEATCDLKIPLGIILRNAALLHCLHMSALSGCDALLDTYFTSEFIKELNKQFAGMKHKKIIQKLLVAASIGGNQRSVNILLDRYEFSPEGKVKSVLCPAICFGHLSMIENLLSRYPTLVDQIKKPRNNRSLPEYALDVAMAAKQSSVMRLLVTKYDAPFFNSCPFQHHMNNIKFSNNTSCSFPGIGLSQVLYRAQHQPRIFQRGAGSRYAVLNTSEELLTDHAGRNLFHFMALGPESAKQREKILEEEGTFIERAKKLIQQSPTLDIKATDVLGFSVLHYVAWSGNESAVKWLISEMGFDVNQTSLDGLRPTHLALWGGHQDVCELLINMGADPDAITHYKKDHAHYGQLGGVDLQNKCVIC